MHRLRLAAAKCAAATALALLCLPATALAGTYTWSLADDFTAIAPGANPGHDHYGASPWSYSHGLAGSRDPSSFQPLSVFNPSFLGGLAGWASDAGASPAAFVAINPSGSPITSASATFAPGQIAMLSAPGKSVAVMWTSPLPQAATLNVTGAVTGDDSGGFCPGGTSWTLDQAGVALPLQTNTPQGVIAATPTVQPGGSIYLVVNSPSCVAGVALQIQATVSVGPTVTLTRPAPESIIRGGQPRFAGSADRGFGASNHVTVHVYNGAGTPVQTLSTTASGGNWSVDPSSALADGVYTVRAEQDDLSSPPDAGLSAPVGFLIHNGPPTLELDSLGATPLGTATPTLRGVASTAAGQNSTLTLAIYAGSDETGSPVRLATATADALGRYSATILPALPDGRYTAVALQPSAAGTIGVSQPRTFRVKIHGPTPVLDRPASGSFTTDQQPTFAGRAGVALGDSTQIEVPVYVGSAARGRLIGTLHVSASGGSWSRRWPRPLLGGVYTAQAVQRDDAGHTSRSAAHTFRILAPSSVVGSTVSLDRTGNASLSVTCPEPAGQTCSGTVQVLSAAAFQPVAGGPIGRVGVLFAYVNFPGGGTTLISRAVGSRLANLFRAHSPLPVRITVTFGDPTRRPSVFFALRVLRRR